MVWPKVIPLSGVHCSKLILFSLTEKSFNLRRMIYTHFVKQVEQVEQVEQVKQVEQVEQVELLQQFSVTRFLSMNRMKCFISFGKHSNKHKRKKRF